MKEIMYEDLIIVLKIMLIPVSIVGLLLYLLYRQEVRQTKIADDIMRNVRKVCKKANTFEECNNAWNTLIEECVNNEFKSFRSYHIREFYELRAVLQYKLEQFK